jgi:hypothetical protein
LDSFSNFLNFTISKKKIRPINENFKKLFEKNVFLSSFSNSVNLSVCLSVTYISSFTTYNFWILREDYMAGFLDSMSTLGLRSKKKNLKWKNANIDPNLRSIPEILSIGSKKLAVLLPFC